MAAAMDIDRIAARVASRRAVRISEDMGQETVMVQHAIYDNTDVSVEELLDEVDAAPEGNIWVKMTGFGWLAVNRDPATLSDDTPVEGGPSWSSGPEDTWGKVIANEYVSDSREPFVKYGKKGDLLADEDFVRFICSYDEGNRDELSELLRERDRDEAADFVDGVEM